LPLSERSRGPTTSTATLSIGAPTVNCWSKACELPGGPLRALSPVEALVEAAKGLGDSDPAAPCMARSTSTCKPLEITICHLSSPDAGSVHARFRTPWHRRSAPNLDHSPLVVAENLDTTSHGGRCCASTHCLTGCRSWSCSCCCLHSARPTICSPRQITCPCGAVAPTSSSSCSSLSLASLRSQYWHPSERMR